MPQVKDFEELADVIITRALLIEIAEYNLALAKKYCPKELGELRDSLNYTITPSENKITVGTNNPYAGHVEDGTRRMVQAHGPHDPDNPITQWDAKSKRGEGTSPQQMPFLRPAAFETQWQLKKILPRRLKLNVQVIMK